MKKPPSEIQTVTPFGRVIYAHNCGCGAPLLYANAKRGDDEATSRGLWCRACHTWIPAKESQDHTEQRG